MSDDDIAKAVLRLVKAIYDELYPRDPARLWHPDADPIDEERRRVVR